MILAAFAIGLPTAPVLVAQCHAAYDALRSYADEGSEENPGVSNGRHEFRTAFVRPNQLRFTFRDHEFEEVFDKDQHWEIWPHEDGYALWSTWSKGFVERGSLRELLQRTDASMETALAIKLFIWSAQYGPAAIDEFQWAAVSGPETVDAAPCFVLTRTGFDTTMTLWIDAKTHFIRRYRWFTDNARIRRHKGQEHWADETTTVTLRPQANPVLDAKAMTFVPPKGVVWTKVHPGGTPDEP